MRKAIFFVCLSIVYANFANAVTKETAQKETPESVTVDAEKPVTAEKASANESAEASKEQGTLKVAIPIAKEEQVVEVAPVTKEEQVEEAIPITKEEQVEEVAPIEEEASSEGEQKAVAKTEESIKRIKIFKYDLQDCNKPGLEPWDMQKILNENDIKAFSSEKGYDGIAYSINDLGKVGLGCLNELPKINIFSIDLVQYNSAESLGFQKCSDLEQNGGNCYTVSELVSLDKSKHRAHLQKCNAGTM